MNFVGTVNEFFYEIVVDLLPLQTDVEAQQDYIQRFRFSSDDNWRWNKNKARVRVLLNWNSRKPITLVSIWGLIKFL